jgi:molybdate transport system substrate-binding protein
VLWSRQPGVVDAQGQVLKTGSFDKIAMANPKLAPYGAAAMQVVQQMGVAAQVMPKVVEGSNIGQTHQFVASGNATLGFVALSQVYENGRIASGSGWIVPRHLYSPIQQDAVLLNPGQGNEAAAAFLRYLQGEQAKSVIRSFGYDL